MDEKPRPGGLPEQSSNPGLDNIKILLRHYAITLPGISVWQHILLIK